MEESTIEETTKAEKYTAYLLQRKQISKEYRDKQRNKLNKLNDIQHQNEVLQHQNEVLQQTNEVMKQQIMDLTKQVVSLTTIKVNEINGFSQKQKMLCEFR
jgi:hypothetical protein